tara:strand:+ start:239 stop:442 length:204 start_codon:yes stop_codon:yes gene_type:complete
MAAVEGWNHPIRHHRLNLFQTFLGCLLSRFELSSIMYCSCLSFANDLLEVCSLYLLAKPFEYPHFTA